MIESLQRLGNWIAHKLIAASWRVRAQVAVFRARTTSRAALERQLPVRVLVVCHGNIYRSIFVADYLERRLPPEIQVRSKGLVGPAGRPSPARHVEMSMAHGVHLGGHQSSIVEPADFSWAEVILIMDRSNWARLRRASIAPGRIVWLGALATGPVEISDPYRMNDVAAAAVLDRLVECTNCLIERLDRNRRLPARDG